MHATNRELTVVLSRPDAGPCASGELAVAWLERDDLALAGGPRLELLAGRARWTDASRTVLTVPTADVHVLVLRGDPSQQPQVVPDQPTCFGASTSSPTGATVSVSVEEGTPPDGELSDLDVQAACDEYGEAASILRTSVQHSLRAAGCMVRPRGSTRTWLVLGARPPVPLATTEVILVDDVRWLAGPRRAALLQELSDSDLLRRAPVTVIADSDWSSLAIDVVGRQLSHTVVLINPVGLDPDRELDRSRLRDGVWRCRESFAARLHANTAWGRWVALLGEPPPFSCDTEFDESAWESWRRRAPIRWFETHGEGVSVLLAEYGNASGIASALTQGGATVTVTNRPPKAEDLAALEGREDPPTQ